ncbi:linoleate 13S-lipoxygenase 2-1 chloroplastic [Prunus yedoensis var. nudiflora]|uniref:Linoleate 13S-lipoxygenase 2-1 chloroplastic n=1 Tax=Prunus yedoensis var. nudiflora TaxID=2094558 RepID=A0A314YLR2_PRUYE|nr:linoleate 13S-lipoxygenase 2-1 chloroplastic [Prunus yedoensis var. nudiflora]
MGPSHANARNLLSGLWYEWLRAFTRPIDEPRSGSFGLPGSPKTRAHFLSQNMLVTAGGFISTIGLTRPLVDFTDLVGKTLLLELVSTQLDPETGLEKETIKGYANKASQKDDEVVYESSFSIPAGFGEVGAVEVENEHHKEVFIKSIHLHGFPNGSVNVPCNSWTHSKFDNPQKRIFFTNKVGPGCKKERKNGEKWLYTPENTPPIGAKSVFTPPEV